MKPFIRGLVLAQFIMLSACQNGSTEDGQIITSAMSPCQCRMSGGCAISWLPKDNGLYADKTHPSDYTDWGQYTGDINVPEQCRKH